MELHRPAVREAGVNQGDERPNGAETDDAERADESSEQPSAAGEAPVGPDAVPHVSTTQAEGTSAGSASALDTSDTSARETAPLEAPASPAATARQSALGQLPSGASAGSYTILRVLRTGPGETVYLAEERGDDDAPAAGDRDEQPLPARRVRLFEREPGSFAGLRSIVQALLRHPRLLAPREIFTWDGKEYLVVEALVAPDGTEAVSVADGARLDTAATLAAGTGLADALSYLHRNGIAHLHVSPDVIYVLNGRAYLDGMETAERIAEGVTDMSALYARDANFLARSLGVLAGIPAEPRPQESPSDGIVRQVAALGASGSFANPDEVAGVCASGLQTSPSLSLESRASQARLSFQYGSATTVGRVRSENQDACASIVFDVYDDVSSDMPLCVFLVADGMGGEARGEMASRIATRTVTAELARQFAFPTLIRPVDVATGEEPGVLAIRPGSQGLRGGLHHAVEEANRRVRLLAGYLGQTTGTTLTVIATQGGQAVLAHLGDSRAYLLRGDTMATLTEDHSVLARLQAIDHPLLSDPDVFVPRNMLYRSLGQEDDPNPDMVDFALADGDRFLICSDGLWDELDDQTLAETLAAAEDPRECAARLVAMANEAGGNDNSTAVVVFVREAVDADAARDAAATGQTGEATDAAEVDEAVEAPASSGELPDGPAEAGDRQHIQPPTES